MHLTAEKSGEMLAVHGVYVTDACDACRRLLVETSPSAYTLRGDPRRFCSRLCRDGRETAPGICRGCGKPLDGARRGAKYHGDGCKVLDRRNNRVKRV